MKKKYLALVLAACMTASLAACGSTAADTSAPAATTEEAADTAAAESTEAADTAAAVSYTHLDVYKRQLSMLRLYYNFQRQQVRPMSVSYTHLEDGHSKGGGLPLEPCVPVLWGRQPLEGDRGSQWHDRR